MEYIAYVDKPMDDLRINVVEIKNLPLIVFVCFYFNISYSRAIKSKNLLKILNNYYKNNLDDVSGADYYATLIKNNLYNLVNIDIRWYPDEDTKQYLINFCYPTSDFLIFESDSLLTESFIKDFMQI